MADYTVNTPKAHHQPRNGGWEYSFYFTVVFALALVVGLLTWSWRIVTTGRLPRLGPLGRALADARAIAPIIYRS
ncbi:cytochrome PufQ [Roseibaca sp. Y0-43]|uniref:cytochrome PufQ n=1 Tax=Roseibaca sp. Y0-43 TaxID=2816854 RepID=UPI001D0C0C95|nr:cytochrome PufQ [Roseibaca sp. Y0-43]MCC1481472.1 hypothetical protein [Roseibaca sp. Y0-43]